MRRLFSGIVTATLVCLSASAQTTQTDLLSLAGESASTNNSFARVSARRPGTWTANARARHSGIIAARVNARRNGETPGTPLPGSNGDSDSSSSGLDSLGNVLNDFLSGSTPSFSDLNGALNSLGGTVSSNLRTSGSSGSSTSSSSSSSSGGLEELLRIRDEFMASQNGSSSTSQTRSDATSSTSKQSSASTSGSTSKSAGRQQSTDQPTTEETPFRIRLADAVLQELFGAADFLISNQLFVDLLESQLRPLFPQLNQDTGGGDGSTRQ
ncbi:MAG: hypothetical protein CHACPFDD_02676 [Phycisphaerae bacterium]|nr:hypothetical protein [Phycisphaerae bacterium]